MQYKKLYSKGILEYKKTYSKAVFSNIFVENIFLKYEQAEKTVVLARAIKKYRLGKGITQAELANRSGFDPKTISRFETGEYVPTVEAVYKFAEILGVPVKDFFADLESEIEQRAFLFEVIHNADADELKRLVALVGKARKASKP